MQIGFTTLAATLFLSTLLPLSLAPKTLEAQAPVAGSVSAITLLTREQASAILPPTVFYRGKSAPIQGRNSGGLKFSGDHLVLATLVDTSGYSTSVQENYQAYLITETTLRIGEKTLNPGAYGVGIIAGNQLIVLDLGAHELFKTPATRDAALPRPTPLQMLPEPSSAGSARLYFGRNHVVLTPTIEAH